MGIAEEHISELKIGTEEFSHKTQNEKKDKIQEKK